MSLKYQTGDESADQVKEAVPKLVLPTPWYTYILLASIAAVFGTQLAFGNALHASLAGDDYSAFVAGFYKPYFLKFHEFWRILTGATIHGGVIHVVMNGYALLNLGKLFEMLSNRAHLAIVFVLSCIGGGVLSLIFRPDGLSVGASGGIVGLLGYITVYAFRRRRFISPEFRKNLVANIVFLAIFGLVLYDVIDNFGHLGGLITGALYGLLQIPADEYADPRVAGPVAKYFGMFFLGLYIDAALLSVFLLTAFHYVVGS